MEQTVYLFNSSCEKLRAVLNTSDENIVCNDEQIQVLFQNIITNFKALETTLAPTLQKRLFGGKQIICEQNFDLYNESNELSAEKLVYTNKIQYTKDDFQLELEKIRLRLRKGTFLHKIVRNPNLAVVHPIYGKTNVRTIMEFAVNLQYMLMDQLKLKANKYVRA